MQTPNRLSQALAKRGIINTKPATVLVACVRKDSKYAYQAQHHVEPFSVQIVKDAGGYVIKGGFGGAYRMKDVDLFAETAQGLVQLFSWENGHDA